jgi:hypothetical protein
MESTVVASPITPAATVAGRPPGTRTTAGPVGRPAHREPAWPAAPDLRYLPYQST